jgi:hypothetical protein
MWSGKPSGTGVSPYILNMETDGNLTVYDSTTPNPIPVKYWGTGTDYTTTLAPFSARLGADCSLIVYDKYGTPGTNIYTKP